MSRSVCEIEVDAPGLQSCNHPAQNMPRADTLFHGLIDPCIRCDGIADLEKNATTFAHFTNDLLASAPGNTKADKVPRILGMMYHLCDLSLSPWEGN